VESKPIRKRAITAGLLFAAAFNIHSTHAEATLERVWSEGPTMPVGQFVNENGHWCSFHGYINGDESDIEFAQAGDGVFRVFFRINDMSGYNGIPVTVLIDDRPFSMTATVQRDSNRMYMFSQMTFKDIPADFSRAAQDGTVMAVVVNGHRRSLALTGFARALTMLNRCSKALTAMHGIPVPTPTPSAQYAQPTQIAPTLPAQIARGEAALTQQGGTFHVQGIINGTTSLTFLIDSGAADVQIPQHVLYRLIREGSANEADIRGTRTYILADGTKQKQVVVLLKSLTVGNRTAANVLCSVGSDDDPILLGQSFLSKFKPWSIDNDRNLLVLD
jgi:clan AA aspartic protease (TIGR02281 family)